MSIKKMNKTKLHSVESTFFKFAKFLGGSAVIIWLLGMIFYHNDIVLLFSASYVFFVFGFLLGGLAILDIWKKVDEIEKEMQRKVNER